MNALPFMASMGGVLAVEVGIRFLHLSPLLLIGFARCVEILVILLIFYVSKNGVSAVGLSRHRMIRGIRNGLIWSAGFGVLASLGGVILFLWGMDPVALIHVGLPQTRSGVVLFFVVGGVIAPIAEEIFFRGVIYGFLRRSVFGGMNHWGLWPALIISTALFVMAHQVGSGIPLPQLVGGVVFCLAYEIEKSLFTPIIIHSLGNLALFTLSCF
ncbi:MAG: CPBP family glutamic-type intramembrane protease [Desulfosalsimonadaceae bacterium]|nr:CPBP family glutamic-type intramembrane protease [Desulfosalsimonadaceae bacterium]